MFVFKNSHTILEDNHDKTTPTNETTCITTTRTKIQRQPLGGVPPELLLRTADILPLSSQAVLSLVNRTISQKLGNQFRYPLYKTPRPQPIIEISLRSPVKRCKNEWKKFQVLLDRDSKKTIYSFYCKEICWIHLAGEYSFGSRYGAHK
jgi:hypothetical protein